MSNIRNRSNLQQEAGANTSTALPKAAPRRWYGSLAIIAILLSSCLVQAADFTVSNSEDAGPVSLRQAILDANNTPGADEIKFDIHGKKPFTIHLLSPLDPITDSLTLNAEGSHVEIDASGVSVGLTVVSDHCLIRGLSIRGASSYGCLIGTFFGDTQDIRFEKGTLTGNYIGIFCMFSSNIQLEHNIITDNLAYGIYLNGFFGPGYVSDVEISHNDILRNGIGLDTANCRVINCHRIEISKNRLNNGQRGCWLQGSGEILVLDNELSQNSFAGCELNGVVDSLLEKNVADENGYGGIGIARSGSRNNFRGNKARNNRVGGIGIIAIPLATRTEVSDNVFEKNDASGNGGWDLVDESIYLFGCVNTWTKNKFDTDNEGDGPDQGCIR